ncbi:MAG: hypothetical protein ACOVQA_10210 [Thermoflexibacteraceae bacterium]
MKKVLITGLSRVIANRRFLRVNTETGFCPFLIYKADGFLLFN